METYEEMAKRLQAKAMADLERDMAEAEREASKDKLRFERSAFLILLIKARQRRRWSQARLAKELKMQQSAISRIESGKGNPSLNTLLEIAKALNVHIVLE